jgi:hypothetical protein
MKINTKALVGLMILFSGLFACKPDPGLGGKAKISGTVEHHGVPIPYAKVYIKYDTNNPPGNSPEAYDDSTDTNSAGKYVFKYLYKGKYYLYATGYDSKWNPPSDVFGGIPVEINLRKEDVVKNILVSE